MTPSALARQLGPVHTVATLLYDRGRRYAQRPFNPDRLRQRGPTAQ